MKKSCFLLVPVVALIAVLSFVAIPLESNFSIAAEDVQKEVAPCSMQANCDKPCCQKMESSACCKKSKEGACCQKQARQHGKHLKCADCEKKAQCEKCGQKGEGGRHCDKPCKTGPCATKSGSDGEAMEELFEKDKS